MPIPGFPGYKAGRDGNVYSYWIVGAGRKFDYGRKPLTLRPYTKKRGHKAVFLKCSDGTKKHVFVHVIIASVFICPRPRPDLQCSHLNGNPADNRPENLTWETGKENMARTLEHGTRRHGPKHYLAKLSIRSLRKLRRLLAEGEISQRQLAFRFGLSPATVCNIKKGKVYANVA